MSTEQKVAGVILSLCLIVGLSGIPVMAIAEQIRFNKTENSQTITIDYQWTDHQQQSQSLRFALDKSIAKLSNRNQKDYKPQIAQRYVYVELMRAAQKIDPKQARVKMSQRGDIIHIEVKSRTQEMQQQWLQTLSEKRESAFDQYLQENHYTRFTNHMGQTGVVPDHLRYIQESKELVLPIAQAIYAQLEEGSDTRDYLNFLLGWVQSIPYDELEDRMSSSGAGYYTPGQVLLNNKGDCDSKAALTASLMKALLPNLSMSIVYLPNHALLAVNLGQRKDELSIDIRGAAHVLLDPTGPAKVPIGKVSDSTAMHIANGSYSTINIP